MKGGKQGIVPAPVTGCWDDPLRDNLLSNEMFAMNLNVVNMRNSRICKCYELFVEV